MDDHDDLGTMLAVVLICAVLGFVIGGGCGAFWLDGFSPSCWWGALIGFLAAFGVECYDPDMFDHHH